MSFNEQFEILRNLGNRLVDYNYPLSPIHFENELSCLKTMDIEVDGYDTVVYFNKSLYDDGCYLETFQIYNKNAPFLPFHLVAKLAQKALGSYFLSLIEFYQNDHKVYCWTVSVDDRGRPLPSPLNNKLKTKVFEGFQYGYLQPEQVNLY